MMSERFFKKKTAKDEFNLDVDTKAKLQSFDCYLNIWNSAISEFLTMPFSDWLSVMLISVKPLLFIILSLASVSRLDLS